MGDPVTWRAGAADEDWKVSICERDIKQVERALSYVAYILAVPGGTMSPEENADVLRQFSGDEIADALLAYRDRSRRSISMGRAE